MAGFTKLFSTIVTSTVWMESDEVLRVWIALLSQADASGRVEGSVPGFAHLCRLSVENFQAAIARLETPDKFSRTPDNEGRRIETISGGWQILNYMKYREARNEDARRKQNAEAQRRWREKSHGKDSKHISQNKPSVIHDKPASAHAEAEAEAEAEHTERPPAARRDEAFEVLCEVCGSDFKRLTTAERGKVNAALKQIRAVEPQVGPDMLRSAARRYHGKYRDAPVTAPALAAHWSELGSGPAPRVSEPAKPLPPIPEPAGWREKLPNLFAADPIMENYVDATSRWETMQRSYQKQIAAFMGGIAPTS